MKNQFGFLYFREPLGKIRYTYFRGATLDDAARKMAGLLNRLRRTHENWSNPVVDHEADVNSRRNFGKTVTQVDLYALGDQHPIHEFLP